MRTRTLLAATLTAAAVTVAPLSAYAGVFTGTSAGEWLTGTSAADTFRDRGGNDTVFGRGGNDTVHPGNGNDRIFAGPGNDTVFVHGADADRAHGGAGDDKLAGDKNDSLWGDSGSDLLGVSGGARASGDNGDDVLSAWAGHGNVLHGGDGNDRLLVGVDSGFTGVSATVYAADGHRDVIRCTTESSCVIASLDSVDVVTTTWGARRALVGLARAIDSRALMLADHHSEDPHPMTSDRATFDYDDDGELEAWYVEAADDFDPVERGQVRVTETVRPTGQIEYVLSYDKARRAVLYTPGPDGGPGTVTDTDYVADAGA